MPAISKGGKDGMKGNVIAFVSIYHTYDLNVTRFFSEWLLNILVRAYPWVGNCDAGNIQRRKKQHERKCYCICFHIPMILMAHVFFLNGSWIFWYKGNLHPLIRTYLSMAWIGNCDASNIQRRKKQQERKCYCICILYTYDLNGERLFLKDSWIF